MIKGWWVALTFAFGIFVLTSCQSMTLVALQPESPEVLLVNITPLDTTMFEQRLKVDLRVRNPNDFDLEVTGLDFTLQLNEQRLARGLMNTASTIPRLGDAILSVETTTSTIDVVRQFLNFRHNQDLTYQVSGVVHVQGGRLPFEHKGVLMDASQFSDSSTGL
jgi:LEA14-like dessication related protein